MAAKKKTAKKKTLAESLGTFEQGYQKCAEDLMGRLKPMWNTRVRITSIPAFVDWLEAAVRGEIPKEEPAPEVEEPENAQIEGADAREPDAESFDPKAEDE